METRMAKRIPSRLFPFPRVLRALSLMSRSLTQRPQALAPEILDELPADHPDAHSSRRDLRWFNAALGNWRWFQMRLPPRLRSGERVLEIGAGTGELGVRLSAQGVAWDGLDRAPRPPVWPAAGRWHQMDVFKFAGWTDYPVIAGNLIFHHFDREKLRLLGAAFSSSARLIMIGDLRRGRLQQWLFWTLARAIRANRVSRHDGWVSIRAGFRGHELPHLLGLDPNKWSWRIEPAQVAAYRFIAERRR